MPNDFVLDDSSGLVLMRDPEHFSVDGAPAAVALEQVLSKT